MKKYIVLICAVLLITSSAAGQEIKRQKLAQTGMKFIAVSTDARVSAMGGAATALELGSTAMIYNPSAMGFMTGAASLSLGQVQWIAGIQYSYALAAFRPKKGNYGTFGIQVTAANYGDFNGTIRDVGESGFLDIGTFSPSAFAVGIGYAKNLSSQFSIGGNVKYVHQDLGSAIIGFDDTADYVRRSYAAGVAAFDFGLLYRTGIESLNFGMCVRNFSNEVTYEDEGFQLPLVFKIGLSANLMDYYKKIDPEKHTLLASVEATHPRDYPEQLNIGLEYTFIHLVSLRGGFSTPNDEHAFSAGIGFRQAFSNYVLAVDYAYTPYDIFEDVHRFSFQFGF